MRRNYLVWRPRKAYVVAEKSSYRRTNRRPKRKRGLRLQGMSRVESLNQVGTTSTYFHGVRFFEQYPSSDDVEVVPTVRILPRWSLWLKPAARFGGLTG